MSERVKVGTNHIEMEVSDGEGTVEPGIWLHLGDIFGTMLQNIAREYCKDPALWADLFTDLDLSVQVEARGHTIQDIGSDSLISAMYQSIGLPSIDMDLGQATNLSAVLDALIYQAIPDSEQKHVDNIRLRAAQTIVSEAAVKNTANAYEAAPAAMLRIKAIGQLIPDDTLYQPVGKEGYPPGMLADAYEMHDKFLRAQTPIFAGMPMGAVQNMPAGPMAKLGAYDAISQAVQDFELKQKDRLKKE